MAHKKKKKPKKKKDDAAPIYVTEVRPASYGDATILKVAEFIKSKKKDKK